MLRKVFCKMCFMKNVPQNVFCKVFCEMCSVKCSAKCVLQNVFHEMCSAKCSGKYVLQNVLSIIDLTLYSQIIHVCNQIIDKHSELTEYWNFQTSAYQRLKSNFRVLHLIPILLVLMCHTKIRKNENKLSIIDLTSYSQSDHILGENSLQSVVNMSQSYFLCNRKS